MADKRGITKFSIVIDRAEGLYNADDRSPGATDVSDPYVILSKKIKGKWKEVTKTKTIKDNLNPKWNFKVEKVGGKEMEAVKLVVWDANFGKSDEYLGEVVLELEEIKRRAGDRWCDFIAHLDYVKEKGKKKKDKKDKDRDRKAQGLIFFDMLAYLDPFGLSPEAQVEVEKSGGIFGEAIRRLATNKDMKVVKELLRAGGIPHPNSLPDYVATHQKDPDLILPAFVAAGLHCDTPKRDDFYKHPRPLVVACREGKVGMAAALVAAGACAEGEEDINGIPLYQFLWDHRIADSSRTYQTSKSPSQKRRPPPDSSPPSSPRPSSPRRSPSPSRQRASSPSPSRSSSPSRQRAPSPSPSHLSSSPPPSRRSSSPSRQRASSPSPSHRPSSPSRQRAPSPSPSHRPSSSSPQYPPSSPSHRSSSPSRQRAPSPSPSLQRPSSPSRQRAPSPSHQRPSSPPSLNLPSQFSSSSPYQRSPSPSPSPSSPSSRPLSPPLSPNTALSLPSLSPAPRQRAPSPGGPSSPLFCPGSPSRRRGGSAIGGRQPEPCVFGNVSPSRKRAGSAITIKQPVSPRLTPYQPTSPKLTPHQQPLSPRLTPQQPPTSPRTTSPNRCSPVLGSRRSPSSPHHSYLPHHYPQYQQQLKQQQQQQQPLQKNIDPYGRMTTSPMNNNNVGFNNSGGVSPVIQQRMTAFESPKTNMGTLRVEPDPFKNGSVRRDDRVLSPLPSLMEPLPLPPQGPQKQ